MNELVLDNIIRHLKYKDLKNLRLVCQRWNQVAENEFWKSSRITVSCNEELLENELEERALESAEKNQMLTDTFGSTFPGPVGLPTNEILFGGCINRSTVEYFWKERGTVTLTSVYFRSFLDPTKESIDLNRYIAPKLSTLTIDFCKHNKFTVSLEMLSNIQNLSLAECEILANGKIVPRVLILTACTVTYEGKQFKTGDSTNIPKLLINNLVDFSKIKKLILMDDFWMLDVGSDATELEHLDLTCVELVGLRNSQWKTNYVNIGNCICICVGDRMELNSISGLNSGDRVDFESLPKFVERLGFEICGSFFALSQPLIFVYPVLKSLTIQISTTDFRILDLTNCSSLVDFQLGNYFGDVHFDFNRIILPNSIKNMKLHKVIPNSDVPWQLYLDTLILCDYTPCFVKGFLRNLTTVKLVIEFHYDLELGEEEHLMCIVNHWRNSSSQELALGGIYWSDANPALKSEFRKSVDGMGTFFLFTDKGSDRKGEAIDFDRFESLSSLKLHKNLKRNVSL